MWPINAVLTALFPARPDKLGKIRDVHTSVLAHRIQAGEVKTVQHVPESGVICTKRWTNGTWSTVGKSHL